MRLGRDGFSVLAAQEKGREAPEWFLDEPELLPGEDLYVDAYWELDTERAIGMGCVGQIPVSRIRAHARRVGLDPSMREVFVTVLRAMDAAALTWYSEQSKKSG